MLADLRERVVDARAAAAAERIERAGSGDLLARVSDDVARRRRGRAQALPRVGQLRADRRADDRRPRRRSTGGSRSPACSRCRPGRSRCAGTCAARRRSTPPSARPAASARSSCWTSVGGARTVRAFGLAAPSSRASPARSLRRARRRVRDDPPLHRASSRGSTSPSCVGTAAILVAGLPARARRRVRSAARPRRRLLPPPLRPDQRPARPRRRRPARRSRASPGWSASRTLPAPAEPPAPPAARATRSVGLDGVAHAYVAGHDVLHGVDLELAPGERVALVGVSAAPARRRSPSSSPASTRRRRAGALGGVPLAALGPAATRARRRARHPGGARLRRPARRRPAAGARRTPTTPSSRPRSSASARSTGRGRCPTGWRRVVGDGGIGSPPRRRSSSRSRGSCSPTRRSRSSTRRPPRPAAPARARWRRAADRVLAGRTALVVAHRLTQAARADRVVVLDAGRVVEQARTTSSSPRAARTPRCGGVVGRAARRLAQLRLGRGARVGAAHAWARRRLGRGELRWWRPVRIVRVCLAA